MGITLSRPGIYVPKNVLDNEFFESIIDTTDEWITKRSGIKERRISLEMGITEMGAIAAKRCLEREVITDQEINEVLFATNLHDDNKEFPSHASYVANQVNNPNATAYDVSAGCSGLVYAIRQAYNNMVAEPDLKRALVVGGERLTDMTDYSDRTNCFLFGDGAGAYLLERFDGEEGIINNVAGGRSDTGSVDFPYGELALENKIGLKLISDGAGSYNKKFSKQNYLVMNGKKVFEFAVPIMEHGVRKVLEGTDYDLEDVDAIIPHGANIRIINPAKNRLKRDGFNGEIYTNLEKYGNTSTASVPIAADEAFSKGIIGRGSLVINVAFGAGFTWGANLYRAR
ncbi:beta-ketoacyl-ACP synthase 3 [archaeon]|jgi:3-oxoacyl-[acyl-carrier-protein] synthase III|nr:beta-ketoacyl-ACP synthase 3 [archaeon]MBT6823981.1 beta-ketoacyl-ACP synthase 3 [archaeon]MBT7106955.1 beta-ketoacyl-ACP synthase 3 [archaeon]MBT7297361.1 beta-ketoacyl-ACP synthase 3 [archaeon]